MEHTKSGFSLIEILVALVIVGMMAAVGFGALRYLAKTKVTQTKTKMQELRGQVEMYKTQTNQYPSKLEDLVKRPANLKGWDGPYVEEDSLKDSWGNEFYYRPNEKGAARPYELYSYGSTGEEGDESSRIDIANL